jgi:hypothetical protein
MRKRSGVRNWKVNLRNRNRGSDRRSERSWKKQRRGCPLTKAPTDTSDDESSSGDSVSLYEEESARVDPEAANADPDDERRMASLYPAMQTLMTRRKIVTLYLPTQTLTTNLPPPFQVPKLRKMMMSRLIASLRTTLPLSNPATMRFLHLQKRPGRRYLLTTTSQI